MGTYHATLRSRPRTGLEGLQVKLSCQSDPRAFTIQSINQSIAVSSMSRSIGFKAKREKPTESKERQLQMTLRATDRQTAKQERKMRQASKQDKKTVKIKIWFCSPISLALNTVIVRC